MTIPVSMSGVALLPRPLFSWRTLPAIPVAIAMLLATASVAAAKQSPDTIIDSGPATQTNALTASFVFHSTASGATFICRLDGSAFVACASPTAFSGLAPGNHNFSVDSSAGGVADPSPATATWTIDTTAPSAPTGLAGTAPSTTSVALTWQAGGDNIAVMKNLINRDGSLLATVGAVTTFTDTTVAPASTHTYTVQAQDGAGNSSAPSNSVAASTPPMPDTLIDSGPAALTTSTTASFTFHSTAAGATFTCRLDTAKAGGCTSPRTYTGLSSATHSFTVFATASGVNDPTPAVANWTIDLTPPTTPTGLTAAVSPTSVTLSWTASTDSVGVIAYDIYRGGGLLASVRAVTVYADSTISLGVTYTYAVRARDAAGNASPQSSAVAARTQASFDPHLTRAPYLTDLVGLHVAINWATDQTNTTGKVAYGVVGTGGSCSPVTEVPAGRTTISVGTVFEYQWKVDLTLPATGTYCYRIFLGNVDLLAASGSPAFTTQVQFGSTESYSFAVFGDWGQVDASGQNAGQAGLMQQIAGSGARFAISVGDNGYPNGSQINYGDLQQSGADTSAIFGSAFWTVPGSSIPLFSAVGNHGVSGVKHTDITTWTQSTAVSTSGGRYQNDVYCCINGTFSSNYGSEWYAFAAGNVRFYILDSAWGDTNGGTATPYANDALAHFAPGTPQYNWLLNDLATHPTQLKFAFFHYPLYSDNPTQPSDTFLDGATNLEGLLGQHGVQLVFNGHAHIYERNRASAAGMPISYVTGGGGATLEPMGTCSAFDAYAIGWSPSHSTGSTCGTAVAPTSAGQVFHFLKVTVNGTSVTVTPTDSNGRTFDVQTYTFRVPTDTYIDSAPPLGTRSTSATFTFHGSGSPATFKCQLDVNSQTNCLSPITYSNLAQGKHTFKVTATYNRSVDPTPATISWTVDTTSPTTPANLTATTSSPFNVNVTWTAATDNLGVTGYDLYRDGSLYQSLAAVTSYSDSVLGSSTHQYAVRARDIAGNVSALGNTFSVTTAPPPSPLFADGFESGDLSAWSSSAGLTVETANINSGTKAAEGNTTTGNTFAKKTFTSTYSDAYGRVWFDIPSQLSQVNLLRLRDATGGSIGYIYVDTTGLLGFRNDATGVSTLSGVSPSPGWHALELHVKTDPATGVVEIWLDNVYVADLSGTGLNTGSAPVGSMQIGEVQASRTYDVIFDDAAFGSARLGPEADSVPPSVPTGLTATVVSPFEADLAWNSSTDNVGVIGYDVFRDGTLIASLGTVLAYNDTATTAGRSHIYAVRATDASGNSSATSGPASATQPAAAPPLFADGFETGDLTSWTTVSGLTVESGDKNAGTSAAEGSTTSGSTFAKKTLGATYADAYARVAFEVKSQASQITLLRLRDTAGGNGGYLYMTSTGKLGFKSDAEASGHTSAVTPGPGWHAIELHLHVNGASSAVEVWLDGAPQPDLSFKTVDLGTVAGIGVLQIGETATSGSWDVIFDDAAFGTSRLGPSGDTTPPSVPANLVGTANSAFSVQLTWGAATDDTGVTGYDVLRDGGILAQVATPGFTDNTVLASTTHQYAVRARDASGNVSPLTAAVSVSTPAAAIPQFADGFESGNTTGWTSATGLAVESSDKNSGGFAAEGSTTAGSTFARKTLASSYADSYARVAFEVKNVSSQVTLLKLRDTTGGDGGYVYLTSGGKLGFRSDAELNGHSSLAAPGAGWHVLELHLQVNGSSSAVEVWLDGAPVPDLTLSRIDIGAVTGIGVLQIGETSTSGAWDLVFDDAAFGTGRLGPSADATPPSVPANVAATSNSPFSVQLTWDPSTDDVAMAGYDLFRDGLMLAQVSTPAYIDSTVLAGSAYQYAVRARDMSGNVSALSPAVSAKTTAAAVPVFADGFETADVSAWTATGGLAVESSDKNSGGFAAEGSATAGPGYARQILSATYFDAYSRVAFKVKSQAGQVTLLRLRDTPTGNGGYVYLTNTGLLAFHSDSPSGGSVSGIVPGSGWHVLELHLFVNGTSSAVDVWFDGVAVPALSSSTANLGTAPIGVLQVGDTANGTWDVLFDDAAFGSTRLGLPGDTTAPTAPANLSATAVSAFSVELLWDASTDSAGVSGYDVMRDGGVMAQVTNPGYVDNTVLAGETHEYTVRARDPWGNVSALSQSLFVTTPAGVPPVFADGFETGDNTAWTATSNLNAETTDVSFGTYSAQGTPAGIPAFARKTLSSTYPDAYARVSFKVNSQVSTVTLLRLRDTPGGNGGYLVVSSATGKLGFHNDATGITTSSVVVPGSGWHVVELHLKVNGTVSVVETWLDGGAVPDLTFSTTDLGTAPIGVVQIGDTQNVTWDVVFDNAAFGTTRLGPTGDITAPNPPANLAGTATPFSVQLTWDASADDVGVTGYDVIRDSAVLASVSLPGYTDNAVAPGEIHQYAVRARDASGNISALSGSVAVLTPGAAGPVFADGFESGNGSAWTTVTGLNVEFADVHSGGFAAEGNPSAGAGFAKKTLPATYADAYARVAFEVKSQGSQVTLLRLRDPSTGNGAYLYMSGTGKLGFRSDAELTARNSTVAPGPGWHVLEVHPQVNGTAGVVEFWLDGAPVPALSFTGVDLGTAALGVLQIGDTANGTWDVLFDDAAFGTSRLGVGGPGGDTAPPSVPANLAASATSAFSVQVTWDASTDNSGVTGYDLFRDGQLLVQPSSPGYSDNAVLASSSHQYAVRARDASNNVSAITTSVSVTTPPAAAPVFADGFESGNASAWNTPTGLVVEGIDVHSGADAAEGNTAVGATFAKKTLPSTYQDAYARVAFEVKSVTAAQVTILRLRDTPTGSADAGFVFVTKGGKLGFHNDALTTNTASAVTVSPGWHVVELHLFVNGTTSVVEVWLDGVAVPDLTSSSTTLGTAPIASLQIGDTAGTGTWDIVLDDAAFGTGRLGVS